MGKKSVASKRLTTAPVQPVPIVNLIRSEIADYDTFNVTVMLTLHWYVTWLRLVLAKDRRPAASNNRIECRSFFDPFALQFIGFPLARRKCYLTGTSSHLIIQPF